MRKKPLQTLSRLLKQQLNEKKAMYLTLFQKETYLRKKVQELLEQIICEKKIASRNSLQWKLFFTFSKNTQQEIKRLEVQIKDLTLQRDELQKALRALFQEKKTYDLTIEKIDQVQKESDAKKDQAILDETANRSANCPSSLYRFL